MREFVVILRSGLRYTVKAERVVTDHPYLMLVVSPAGAAPNAADAVAMFEQHLVLAVVSREHLISEEKGEPIAGPHVVGNTDVIPF